VFFCFDLISTFPSAITMVASEESEVDIEVEEMQYSSEVDDDREEEEGGEDELEESENDQQSVRRHCSPNENEGLRGDADSGTGRPAENQAEARGAERQASLIASICAREKCATPLFSRRGAVADCSYTDDDIESEDSDSEDSNTYTAAPSSSRQLTARQAVLANTAGPSHVALGASNHLNLPYA
jgi:hypothetical protein